MLFQGKGSSFITIASVYWQISQRKYLLYNNDYLQLARLKDKSLLKCSQIAPHQQYASLWLEHLPKSMCWESISQCSSLGSRGLKGRVSVWRYQSCRVRKADKNLTMFHFKNREKCKELRNRALGAEKGREIDFSPRAF